MENGNPLILAVETSGRLGSVAIAQGPKLLAEKQFSGPMRHSAEVFPAIVNLLKQFSKKPNQLEQVHISIGPGSFTGLRIAVTLAKTMALANPAPVCLGNSAKNVFQHRQPDSQFSLFGDETNRCGTKIVAVDTLDCIAANVINLDCPLNAERCPLLETNERLAAILDAKRGQFFIAVYDKTNDEIRTTNDSIRQKILPDCLLTAEEFVERFTDKPIALIGEGLVFYKDKFNNPAVRVLDEKFWNPSAANVHRLGWHKARLAQFADPLTLAPNYLRGTDAKVKLV